MIKLSDFSKYEGYLKPAVSCVIFLLALTACYQILKEINPQAVEQAIGNIPGSAVVLAFLATAVSFLMLFGYEWSADKYVGGKLTLKKIAFGGFCSFAISNALGLAIFSGGAVRYRLYKHHNMTTMNIAKMSLFASFSFNVTIPLLIAFLILTNTKHVSSLFRLSVPFLVVIAVVVILIYVLLIVYLLSRRLPQKTAHTFFVKVGKYRLEVPNIRLCLTQFVITSLDAIAAGTVLYFLLPHPPAYESFLIVYFIALGAGAVSNIPGGLGVFEAILLAAFSQTIGLAEIMAALVLYRLIYTVVPFVIATILLLMHEFRRLRQKRPLRFSAGFVPPIMATLVFFSGFLLILSGSVPEFYSRLKYIGVFLPPSLIDTFHLVASLIGMLCLLLAHGLYKRLSGAWFLTVCLLIFGGIFSLLKGFDWEEAVLLFTMSLLLVPFRSAFHRTSRLSQLTFSPQYLLVVGCVLILALMISFFNYKNVEYSQELWWQIGLDDNLSRSFRALFACAIVLLFFGLRWLLYSPFRVVLPDASAILTATKIYKNSDNPDTGLALSGDKMLLFNEEKDAFIMYGHHRKSLITLYDPIGPPEKMADLIWQFKDLCDQHLFHPIFYQITAKNLPMYMDMGLMATKVGEEAIIHLKEFSLDDKKSKEMRYTYNRGHKDGCSLEVCEPGTAPFDALKIISDQWLATKKVREKGFSLGRFDVDYLNRFRIAVVKQNERIIAFANLFETNRKCTSIDLMRYCDDAPKSIMFFLMISLIMYYKEQDYHRFSLGMAPLSGLVVHKSSPLTQKITEFLYRKGKYFYNFQGLRYFKEKFNPQWEPRYIAAPRDCNTLLALADTSMLIAGGVTGMIKK